MPPDHDDNSKRNSTQPVSVVIPAHNEESVLGRCLSALLKGAAPGELEIIVVCNGCKDNTAEIGRSFGPSVKVIETDIPSKVNALNMGDREACGFPRFYIDADVEMSLDALKRVAQVLRKGPCLAAAPRMEVDLTGCSLGVRAFYAIWKNQPYFDKMIGTGVYAISQQGRARFDSFPNITADDEFVRLLFSEEERTRLDDASFTVSAPRNLNDLIKVRTRSRRGNMELQKKIPTHGVKQPGGMSKFVGRLIRQPLLWPAIPVYFLVQATALVRAKKTIGKSGPGYWERDDSSRSAAHDKGRR